MIMPVYANEKEAEKIFQRLLTTLTTATQSNDAIVLAKAKLEYDKDMQTITFPQTLQKHRRDLIANLKTAYATATSLLTDLTSNANHPKFNLTKSKQALKMQADAKASIKQAASLKQPAVRKVPPTPLQAVARTLTTSPAASPQEILEALRTELQQAIESNDSDKLQAAKNNYNTRIVSVENRQDLAQDVVDFMASVEEIYYQATNLLDERIRHGDGPKTVRSAKVQDPLQVSDDFKTALPPKQTIAEELEELAKTEQTAREGMEFAATKGSQQLGRAQAREALEREAAIARKELETEESRLRQELPMEKQRSLDPSGTAAPQTRIELAKPINAVLDRILDAINNSKEYKQLLTNIAGATDSDKANDYFEQLETTTKPAFTKAGKEFQNLQQELFLELVNLRNELLNHPKLNPARIEKIGKSITTIQDNMQKKEYRTFMGNVWHNIMGAVKTICDKVKTLIAHIRKQEKHVATPHVYTGGYKSTFYQDALKIAKGDAPEPPPSPKTQK